MVNRQGDRADNPHLVVGADSTLGGALIAGLRAAGEPVLGTSRRAGSAALALDLGAPARSWQLPERAAVTTICAAMTRIAVVADAADQASRVNRDAVLELARIMAGRGSRVAFLSSAQVFDGSVACTPAEAPVRPITLYGRLKAETEAALARELPDAAILRLSKVVDPGLGLFHDWIAALRSGAVVTPFADAVISPVALPLVVRALIAIGHGGEGGHGDQGGIFQLSARDQISYAAIAGLLAKGIGAAPDLVRPVPADPELWPGGPRATLDCSRLERLFGIAAPASHEAVAWFLAAYSKKMKPQSPL